MSIEGRLTLCNMSAEAGARAGLVAPDQATFAALGRCEPTWEGLRSDPGAGFDRSVEIDAALVAPMVTWGTSPEDVAPITGVVPQPIDEGARNALDYMALDPGQKLDENPVENIFLGAGFEWREPGCSMCLAMNPDRIPPGERCASTSNRNFIGRQGPGARTHLLSPAMAAAAAIAGRLADVRSL